MVAGGAILLQGLVEGPQLVVCIGGGMRAVRAMLRAVGILSLRNKDYIPVHSCNNGWMVWKRNEQL